MPATLSNGFFFNEFLADNAGGNAYDTDGDGGSNKADEFVEIRNTSKSTISLDGMQLWSAKRGLLYDFGTGNTTASNGTATVVGQYDGAEPSGFFDAGLPDNNNNQGFLEDGENNRFDTLYLVDTNTGEYIALLYGDPPQAQSLPSGFPGTTLMGTESINSNAPNGVPIARDANGNLEENTTPTPGNVCYLAGTLIETATGPQAIETLRPGASVLTRDHGLQPLRWIGRKTLGAGDLARHPKLSPIRIAAGALDTRRPTRDLFVSPQHRMLIKSRISQRMFGAEGILVPAVKLLGLPGVSQLEVSKGADYFHLLFDRHEIIFAEGCPSESLLIGPMARLLLGAEPLAEIEALFPGLIASGAMAPARSLAHPQRVRRLVARHAASRHRHALESAT